MLRKLARGSEALSSYPNLGEDGPEFRDGMRKWTVGNYIILYRIIGDGIEVVRYVDARRDPRSFLR